MKTSTRSALTYIVFVAPAVLFFVTFILFPLVRAIIYSFQDWDGIASEASWVGWGNYKRLLDDTDFGTSFMFTFKYVAVTTILFNLSGFLLALALNMALKSRNLLRTGFFLPHVVGSVIIGFIWQFIIVQLFGEIGKATGIALFQKNWLSMPDMSFWSIVIVAVWHSAGYFMVIYLAALQGVPRDLLEASEIDGAGRMRRLWSVTLPLIRPAMTVCFFLAISSSFKAFDLNFSLTRGGPFGSTESLALQIYSDAFVKNLFTYGAAKAVVFFLVLAGITLVQVGVMKRKEVEM